MTLLNTHMCVRVEKRMEGQTPKGLQWLFLDFARKGGLHCLLCSLPQFSKMFAMSPEICLSQIKDTHWKKLFKRRPLLPKVKNSFNSASYHKGIQSWSEMRCRCAWKHLPLPVASESPCVPEKIPLFHPLFSKKQPQVGSYLANQLQGVPGSVSWPDDRQGWLIIWQTEPGWSEILMDPNVTVRIVLVDAR